MHMAFVPIDNNLFSVASIYVPNNQYNDPRMLQRVPKKRNLFRSD